MARRTSKRLSPQILEENRKELISLGTLTDYSPTTEEHSMLTLKQLEAALSEAEVNVIMAIRALQVAREQEIEAGLRFHKAMQGAKAQVIAQYGEDSPALHAIGRKQKSERRPPRRRAAAAQ